MVRDSRKFAVVGNPENRRVVFFQEALARRGLPYATCVPWVDVIDDPETALSRVADCSWLRIDSPGENNVVRSKLLRLGEHLVDERFDSPRIDANRIDQQLADYGRIVAPRQWFLGFRHSLRKLGRALERYSGVGLLNAPGDIELLCDKRDCHAKLSREGIPVPRALPTVVDFDSLMDTMRQQKHPRVFVKLANGSSASGVMALETNGLKVQAFTSVEIVRQGSKLQLFNSLRVRRYTKRGDIRDIVNTLCREGVHVESWFAKAGWQGRRSDLRMLTIAGVVEHCVLRLSKHPMTNLQLGNSQGDLAGFVDAMGLARWGEVLATCQRAASLFGLSHHVAFDVAVNPRMDRHVILEANAFGDLLPRVSVDGHSPCDLQIERCLGASACA